VEIKKGNREKTRELLKKVITAQCGVQPEDNYQLGNAYFFNKKPDHWSALAAYLEADRLASGNAKYLNMAGQTYHVLGEYNQALPPKVV
jgi:tetratricopeptide (TPR) repeat protein